jgi:HNH endonuclease
VRVKLGRQQWSFTSSETLHTTRYMTQQSTPVLLFHNRERGEDLWWYMSLFYWEETRLTPQQFQALLERKHTRKRQQAISAINAITLGKPLMRQPIPVEVKNYVYERDRGRCQNCGRVEELQFDHIIPVAKGGSATAANLQLLCGPCNRSKGVNLG